MAHDDPLKNFQPQKEFFVGIDSDGCAFPTMELKHKECFIPNIIKSYGLQSISKYAPRLLTTKVPPDKIGKVIGPGGSFIKSIEAETGATVEIEDDGSILVACMDVAGAERAL